jgi:hypothetical protein
VATCVFHASRFEMKIIFGMPISLAVCTLSNTYFVFGGSNFILHCCIYCTLNISLLFGAGFSSAKKKKERDS